MVKELSDNFISICRQNFLNNITPSNKLIRNEEGYKRIVNISLEYFKNGDYNEFEGFFQEEKYFIALWAAHMLVEFGKPNKDLIIYALSVIKKYTDNPLSPAVAIEEKLWLSENSEKYREFL